MKDLHLGRVLLVLVPMLGAIGAGYYYYKPKPQMPPVQQDITQHEIDFDKIKTVDQLKNVVYAMTGGKLFLNVRKDSLSDAQMEEKLKELFK